MIRWLSVLIVALWSTGALAVPCLTMTMPTLRTNGEPFRADEIKTVEIAWSRVRLDGRKSRGNTILSGPQTRYCYKFLVKGDYLFRARVIDTGDRTSDWTPEIPWKYR